MPDNCGGAKVPACANKIECDLGCPGEGITELLNVQGDRRIGVVAALPLSGERGACAGTVAASGRYEECKYNGDGARR